MIYEGLLRIGDSMGPRCTGHKETIGNTRHSWRILTGTGIGKGTSEGPTWKWDVCFTVDIKGAGRL
jgi:hypothetical protein